jgi:hypothetical protein
MNKDKNIALQLSWPQIWVCVSVIGGLFGSIFAAGKKVEQEVSKFNLSKQEQIRMDSTSSLNTKLREANADANFFKSQYIKTHSRLKACIKKDIFTNEIEIPVAEIQLERKRK